MSGVFLFLLERLKEPSTWITIALILSQLGAVAFGDRIIGGAEGLAMLAAGLLLLIGGGLLPEKAGRMLKGTEIEAKSKAKVE